MAALPITKKKKGERIKQYPQRLVYGFLFSKKYQFEIIKMIESEFGAKPIDIGALYHLLVPILKESEQYKLYEHDGDLKHSLFQLLCHFTKQQILANDGNGSFVIHRKFNHFGHKLR